MSSVSVIIPAYNAAGVIDSALASIAGQTRSPDEVVVVDDGSTDATVEVVSSWSDRLPIELLVLPENVGRGLGAGGARAKAIEASAGTTLALLDADDVWLPDHLEVMLAEHELHGGLITGNYVLWMPGRTVGTVPAADLVPVPSAERQRLAILSENFVFVSSVFSRELYDAAGPFRNIRCEDWDLWIRMVRAGAEVTIPQQVTVLYRQDPDSVSGTDKLLIGDIDLLTELLPTCTDEERPVVKRALQRRRAKQLYLEGIRRADEGDTAGARRAWIDSLGADPSLRGNRSKLNGRVSLRAAACILAPRTMTRLRHRRQADAELMVGNRNVTTGRSR